MTYAPNSASAGKRSIGTFRQRASYAQMDRRSLPDGEPLPHPNTPRPYDAEVLYCPGAPVADRRHCRGLLVTTAAVF